MGIHGCVYQEEILETNQFNSHSTNKGPETQPVRCMLTSEMGLGVIWVTVTITVFTMRLH